MNISELPIEILEIVLSQINDTETYLTSRKVCQNWYRLLQPLKIFSNGKYIKKIEFRYDKIIVTSNLDKLLSKYEYLGYGKSKYEEFEGYEKKTITINSPFKAKSTNYISSGIINTKLYDFRKVEVFNSNVSYPQCTIS